MSHSLHKTQPQPYWSEEGSYLPQEGTQVAGHILTE